MFCSYYNYPAMDLILNNYLITFILTSQVLQHRTLHNYSIIWCFLDDTKFSHVRSSVVLSPTKTPATIILIFLPMDFSYERLAHFRSEFPSESNTKSPTWCVTKLSNHFSFLDVWNLEVIIDRRPLHHLFLTSQLCLWFCVLLFISYYPKLMTGT